MRINELIKELRTNDGMTQVDLAEKLNCNRQKIADWERGKSTPSADDIVALTKIFDVSSDYLLGLTKAATNDKDLQFICEYTGLNENAINLIKISSPIREIINYFLNEKDDRKKVLVFSDYCLWLEVYKSSLNKWIADNLKYNASWDTSDLIETKNGLVRSHTINLNVDLSAYRVEITARKLAQIYVEEQLKEIERLKALDRRDYNGDDQETQ